MRHVWRSVMVIMCLALAGCIEVEDFGAYWDEGAVDRRLLGSWEAIAPGGDRLVFEREDGRLMRMRVEGDKESEIVRALDLGGHGFLMIKTKAACERSGSLQRYRIVGGMLEFYSPRKRMKQAFETHYAGRGIAVANDIARIKLLDERAANALAKIAGRPEYWEMTTRYRKIR